MTGELSQPNPSPVYCTRAAHMLVCISPASLDMTMPSIVA